MSGPLHRRVARLEETARPATGPGLVAVVYVDRQEDAPADVARTIAEASRSGRSVLVVEYV